MSLVGQFPGIHERNFRAVRAPVNSMDKSTIVSIYPKLVVEIKHTIEPGIFKIPAGSYEKPGVLVVGPSSWWRHIDAGQPMLEIPQSSIVIADSIVKDFCNGILGCDMNESMPGFFYVPGAYDLAGIKKNFQTELDRARVRQHNYYSELLKMADSLWARSNGNPLAVSEDMRLAAKELNVANTKDWMKNFEMTQMVRCNACGSLKNPDYPVCSTCRAVDKNHPKAKEFEFVS